MNAKNETPEALAVLDTIIKHFMQPDAAWTVELGKARAAFAAEHIALKEMRDLFDLMCGLGFNPTEGHEGSPKANADAALAAVEKLP